MTRNQALRLAIMALNKQASELRWTVSGTFDRKNFDKVEKKIDEQHSELAEAIKILENMMRQKEMDL